MQLHLEGTASLNASRDDVYSLLTDAKFIAKTLPDAEDVRVLDGSTLEAKLKLRIAVVSSNLRTKMTVERSAPPTKAALSVEGSGSGSSVKVRSVFELSGEKPTAMKWSADAEINGVMAGIGSALLKGFATKKVGEIFSGIAKAVESETSPDAQASMR